MSSLCHTQYKPSSHYKGPLEFEKVRIKQDLGGTHLGAVWVMEFSICGRLLATAGQDSVVVSENPYTGSVE